MNKEHINQHLCRLTAKKILVVDESDLLSNSISVELTDTYDIMVFDYATPYQRYVDEVKLFDQLTQLNLSIDWIIITSNFMYYHSDNSQIVYYPIYLIDGIDKAVEKNSWFNPNIQQPRRHNLSFLTYHLHWHRILSLISLYKQTWFNTCLINLLPIDKMNASQLQGYQAGILSLDSTELETMNELFKLAPLVADKTDDQREIVNVQNRAFTDCYINMFTESDYARPFITEKSIKPFLTGQFTAVLAHNGLYNHLRELGFDLLSDYINLDFEIKNVSDVRLAINNVVDQIDKLLPNIEQAWKDTYTRRQHNYNLARSPALRSNLCQTLSEQLNKHTETV
jgi:hypothetical protein